MGYSAEPPCRSRRLEPFRQSVREECRLEAATYCTTRFDVATPSATAAMSPPRPRGMTTTAVTHSTDLWLNSLMESILESPSSSTPSEDSFDNFMNSMLNEFLGQMMDLETMMTSSDGTDSSLPNMMNSLSQPLVPLAEEPNAVDTNAVKEEVAIPSSYFSEDTSASSSSSSRSTSSDDESAATTFDEVAENSLDVLVAKLAQRFIHSEDDEEDTNDPTSSSSSSKVENLSQRLSQLGNDLLSETRIARRRRRLQEASSTASEEEDVKTMDDRQLHVKERLARRLTEYRTDLVYHPGGMVTVYTSAFQQPHSPSSSSSFSSFHHPTVRALPSNSIVSPLGMGSTHVDECIQSRYENGDLAGACFVAVQRFFAAVNDRNLSPPSHSSGGGGGGGDDKPWYYEFLIFSCLGMLVALPIELYLCLSRTGAYAALDDDEDNENHDEGGEISFDYEMLPEQRSSTTTTDHDHRNDERREKVPRVYLGVPVQVV